MFRILKRESGQNPLFLLNMMRISLFNPAEVEAIVAEIVAKENLKLVGVTISGSSFKPVIQVYADLEVGYISVGQCLIVGKKLKLILSEASWCPENFSLEVSSPGVSAPLTEIWQFKKNIGKLISHQDVDGTNFEGRIVSTVGDNIIQLDIDGEVKELTLQNLIGSTIVLEFSPSTRKTKRSKNETKHR